MTSLVEQHLDAIRALCREYGVNRLDLFGSAATGAFREEDSDVDFVAAFADTRAPGYADRYFGLAEALEALLGRDVDLVTDRSIRNPNFRRAVDVARQPLYERRDQETAA